MSAKEQPVDSEWEATVNDLKEASLEGQVELVDGKMIQLPFHTLGEARTIANILVSLMRYEDHLGTDGALSSTTVYVVDLPHRKTFSPDVSFTVAFPEDPMGFIPGAPIFAAEVRAPDELTAAADFLFATERSDYFAAGTDVVWDVDPWNETVKSYSATHPEEPINYRRGMIADAEPALPGWALAVADVFARRQH
jgi:Uma2 family endonuclease